MPYLPVEPVGVLSLMNYHHMLYLDISVFALHRALLILEGTPAEDSDKVFQQVIPFISSIFSHYSSWY